MMKSPRHEKRRVSGVRQLTAAEIEALQEDSQLATEYGRVRFSPENAASRGATAVEIESLQTKLKSIDDAIKSNNRAGNGNLSET